MSRTKVRLTGLLVLSITFGAVSANASNAAPTLAPSPSTSGISSFPKGTIKPQSIAYEGGGVTSPDSKSVADVITDINSVARSAGGWAILGKSVQIIYVTVRACPQCFFP